MRRVAIIFIIGVAILTGCSKISYSPVFQGVPIYPSTQLMTSNTIEEDKYSEMYTDMFFKGNIDSVKKFYEKSIDRDLWEVKEVEKDIPSHGIDKICAYTLSGKERTATITIAYSSNEKTGKHIYITIIGDK